MTINTLNSSNYPKRYYLLKSIILASLLSISSWATAGLNIFACEPEWGALAKDLAPDADIYTATTAYQDPHNIQARPSLLAKARQADLIVCTGAELEIGWLPVVLRRAGNRAIQPGNLGHFMAAEQVERLEVPQNLSMMDRSMGDVHASGNPHVHLDPERLLDIAGKLSTRLQQINPDQSAQYQQAFTAFQSVWNNKIPTWKAQAAPLQGQQVVVHHKSWVYFTTWLGMTVSQTLEPKPGIPPSASHMQQVIGQLRQQPALAIIYGPAVDDRAAKRVGEATNIPVIAMPYTVGTEGADNLVQLFDTSIQRLLTVSQ